MSEIKHILSGKLSCQTLEHVIDLVMLTEIKLKPSGACLEGRRLLRSLS